jgi:branched-chain amino acid transport system permease protein
VKRRAATLHRRAVPGPVLAAGSLVAIAILAIAPLVVSSGDLRLFTEILTVFAFAQSWNLLAGYGGLMSFGQQGFIGIGAYALYWVSNRAGVNPYLVLPIAFLLPALIAAAIAPMVFRLRDAYFAIGIWVLAEVARLYVTQSSWLDAVSGMSLEATRTMDRFWVSAGNYWVAAVLAVIAVIGLYFLLHSRFGLALKTVRDNENTAAAIGIDIWRTRFIGFVLASGFAGIAGATYYMSVFHVDPGAAFDANWTVVMLFIVIIGGIGTIEGPIIGTAIYFALRGLFADVGNWYLMLLGAAAVVTMLFEPKGIWGFFEKNLGLEIFSARRHPPAGDAPE